MRILIAVLVIGLAAAALWGFHDPERPQPAVAVAPSALATTPSAPAASGAIAFSPRPPESIAAASAPAPGAAPTPVPPAFSIVGAILFPGRKAALTLRVAGELRTVAEGDMIEGYRVERIDRDRVALLHVDSGRRLERLYADSVPASTAPVVASASAGGTGPYAPPAVASTPPLPSAQPPVNYTPPRAPAGATINDNPLVGAIIPNSPGQAPPGMSGPRPVPLRPGQAPPPGPIPTPVPPNAQGPVAR